MGYAQQVGIRRSAGAVLLLFVLLGAGPGTWTYDAEIHPGLPKLTFTLLDDQGSGASIAAVEIRREGESEPFQTIDGLSVEPPDDGARPTLEVIDMNFDGYGDFRIVEFLPAGPDVPFLNWLYDAERDAFVSSAALDDLPSPTFDAETRRVTSSWRDGAATYGTDVYEWSGEELIVVQQELKEYTAPGRYRLTVRQRIDGELEITEEREVEEGEEEESIPAALVAESELSKPSFPAIDADAPPGTGVTQPCLAPLERVRCGRFRVWEDRAARTGRTLDLAFIVADALEPGPGDGDAITFFNGGPGSSTTATAAEAIAFSDAFRQRRDLLFLDFRGVGASGPLDCGIPYPGGIASRFGTIFPLDHIRACRDRLSQRARLELYTSNHNMDDLEELRQWLNYTALNLVGGSYGTREIQVFLRRHPKSVRTVILLGVSPLFAPGYVSHARGLQQALDELVRECASQADCAAAYPNFDRTVEEVLSRVRRDPPAVEVEGETVPFGPGELGYALRGLLYGRAAEVPALLTGARRGEWQPLADYYLQRSGWVAAADGETGMHFSVLCAEDIDRVSAEQIEELTADTFLGDYLIGAYVSVCREWPHARLPPSFWEPVSSPVPALLFSGSRDPVTPPSGGDAVAAHLPNSLHVVVPGAGHLLFGPCFDRIQAQFLKTGSVEGLDLSCIEERPPTAFVLPGNEPGRRPAGK